MATVHAARTVKTTTATTSWPPDRAPPPITTPAAAHIARFFGLTPESRKPRPNALPAVNLSIADIHFGSSACFPGAGLLRHCFTLSASSNRPSSSLTQDAAVDGSPPELMPVVVASQTKIVVATTMPAIQPIRKPKLVPPARGAKSIRITAMIGTGLIATPTARGSRSPMTSPMIPLPSWGAPPAPLRAP